MTDALSHWRCCSLCAWQTLSGDKYDYGWDFNRFKPDALVSERQAGGHEGWMGPDQPSAHPAMHACMHLPPIKPAVPPDPSFLILLCSVCLPAYPGGQVINLGTNDLCCGKHLNQTYVKW